MDDCDRVGVLAFGFLGEAVKYLPESPMALAGLWVLLGGVLGLLAFTFAWPVAARVRRAQITAAAEIMKADEGISEIIRTLGDVGALSGVVEDIHKHSDALRTAVAEISYIAGVLNSNAADGTAGDLRGIANSIKDAGSGLTGLLNPGKFGANLESVTKMVTELRESRHDYGSLGEQFRIQKRSVFQTAGGIALLFVGVMFAILALSSSEDATRLVTEPAAKTAVISEGDVLSDAGSSPEASSPGSNRAGQQMSEYGASNDLQLRIDVVPALPIAQAAPVAKRTQDCAEWARINNWKNLVDANTACSSLNYVQETVHRTCVEELKNERSDRGAERDRYNNEVTRMKNCCTRASSELEKVPSLKSELRELTDMKTRVVAYIECMRNSCQTCSCNAPELSAAK